MVRVSDLLESGWDLAKCGEVFWVQPSQILENSKRVNKEGLASLQAFIVSKVRVSITEVNPRGGGNHT